MQLDKTLLDVLRVSSNDVKNTILSELSYEVLSLYYNYICKKQDRLQNMYPEDILLQKLGYDLSDRAEPILRDFLLYTVEVMEKASIKEAEKLVKNYDSYIYVELAHYDYDIGFNMLRDELERIHANRNIEEIDMDIYDQIFGENHDHSVYNAVISIAKYIRNKHNESVKIVQPTESDHKILALA